MHDDAIIHRLVMDEAELLDELSALYYFIGRYGLRVDRDDGPYQLMDGSRSPIAVRVADPALLAQCLAHALASRDRGHKEQE